MKKLLFILLSSMILSNIAVAEDGVFCAMVIPTCNENGQAEFPYNQGLCAEYYNKICNSQAAKLNCEDNLTQLFARNEELSKQLKKARKQLRAARK